MQQALLLERCERRATLPTAFTAATKTAGNGVCSTAPANGLQHPYRTLEAFLHWTNVIGIHARGSLPLGFVPLLVSCGVEGGQMETVEQLVTKLIWPPQVQEPQLACCSPQFVSRAELICEAAWLGHTPFEAALQQLHALTTRVGLTAAPDCKQLRDAVAPLVQLAMLLLYRRQFDHVEAIAQLLPPRSVTMAQVAVPLLCVLLADGDAERAARACLRYLPAGCGRSSIAMHVACVLAQQPAVDMVLVRNVEEHALGSRKNYDQEHRPKELNFDLYLCRHSAPKPWDNSVFDIVAAPSEAQAAAAVGAGSIDSYAPPPASEEVARAVRLRPIESLITGLPGSTAHNSVPTCLGLISRLACGGEQLRGYEDMALLAGGFGDPFFRGFVRWQLLPSLGVSVAAAVLVPGEAALASLQHARRAADSEEFLTKPVARELALAEARALLLGGHVKEAVQASRSAYMWAHRVLQAFAVTGEPTPGSTLLVQPAPALLAASALPGALPVLRQLIPPVAGSECAMLWMAQQHAAASAASPSDGEHALVYAAEHLSHSACTPMGDVVGTVIAPLATAGQWRAALKFIRSAPDHLRRRWPSVDAAAIQEQAREQLPGAYKPVAEAAAAEVVRTQAPSPEAGLAIAMYLESWYGPPLGAAVQVGRSTSVSKPSPAPNHAEILGMLQACVAKRVAHAWRYCFGAGGSAVDAAPFVIGEDDDADALVRERAHALQQQWQAHLDVELQHQLWVVVAGHMPHRGGQRPLDDDAPLAAAYRSLQQLQVAVEREGCPKEALFCCLQPIALTLLFSQKPSSRLVAFTALVAAQGLEVAWSSFPHAMIAQTMAACSAKPEWHWLRSLLLHDLAWCWARHWGATQEPMHALDVVTQVLQEHGRRLVSSKVRWNADSSVLMWTARALASCPSPSLARSLLHALATGVAARGPPQPEAAAPLLLEAAIAEAGRADHLAGLCSSLFRLCCELERGSSAAPDPKAARQAYDAVFVGLKRINAADGSAPNVLWRDVREVIERAIGACMPGLVVTQHEGIGDAVAAGGGAVANRQEVVDEEVASQEYDDVDEGWDDDEHQDWSDGGEYEDEWGPYDLRHYD